MSEKKDNIDLEPSTNNGISDCKDIMSYDIKELTKVFVDSGEKAFRAKQVYTWLHQNLVADFDEMTNLSKSLREDLKGRYDIRMPRIVEKLESSIDGTRKYLFELYDGCVIESVFMKYKHGNSVCISSQVGCRMGCRFCASTINGLERNLTPSEMLGQIYGIQKDTKERVSNIVIMGSGEPLDNYDNVIKFLKLISCEEGLNISLRNLTLSTCGLVDKVKELANLNLQLTLAISLHSPTDELRRSIMPIANKYSLEEIIDACKYYFSKTKRRISFEYSLIKDLNDTPECATELIRLIKGLNCHVNLIPINPIKERDYTHSDVQYIQSFKNMLEKQKINVTIRREMGADINAACGQLRRSYIDQHKNC